MSTAQPLPPSAEEPTGASTGASFWDGAPKLVAGLATLVGSLAAVATVLVQAGVFGSPSASPQTTQAQTIQARTAPAVAPKAETPSLDGALRSLNELLNESAHTRGDLGALIADVERNPPIDRAAALREIDAIVRQREGLHRTVAGLSAPDELSNALALLRDSVTASLADDRLVRQWFVALYDGDAAADRLREAHLEASAEATRAKDKFRAEYAGILLAAGLSSSIPEY